jgi:hypothetical protein
MGARGFRIEGEDQGWLLARIAEAADLALERCAASC